MSAAQIYRLDLAARTLPCACVFLLCFSAAVPRSRWKVLGRCPRRAKPTSPLNMQRVLKAALLGGSLAVLAAGFCMALKSL